MSNAIQPQLWVFSFSELGARLNCRQGTRYLPGGTQRVSVGELIVGFDLDEPDSELGSEGAWLCNEALSFLPKLGMSEKPARNVQSNMFIHVNFVPFK